MKKYIKILVLLLPVFGFSQTVDLASWALSANGNATQNQSYITPSTLSQTGLLAPEYSTDGVKVTGWGDGSTNHYRFFEVTITATAAVHVSDLAFTHASFGPSAPANYMVKYCVGAFQDDYQFFYNQSTTLVNQSFAGNGTKILTINKDLSSGQKLTIRFYTAANAWSGSGWNIKQNTLKITGNPILPLAGTYYINSTLTPNFPTLTEAIRVLHAVGVSAPVTFALDSNTYSTATGETFPLEIKNFTGTSATNTLTIKPNNKTVLIESNSTSVFSLTNAARNVIIDGNERLTLYANTTGNVIRASIMLASTGTNRETNGINNHVFKNLTLKQNFDANGQTYAGVYATGISSKITIDNVIMQDVSKGVFLDGGTTSGNLSNYWTINKISFSNSGGNKPSVGIYMNNAETYTISNNTIQGITKVTTAYNGLHSGIFITGSSSGSIFNNTIQDIYNSTGNSFCSGIYINSSNNVIYNNIITNVRSAQTHGNTNDNIELRGHGIYHRDGANNKIYFNTIVMNSDGNATQRAAAIYLPGGTAVTIKNNILYNVQNVGTQYAIYATIAAAQITSDYNDLIAPMTGYFGADRQTLAQWRTATGKDANSLDIAPYFAGSQLRLNTTHPNNLLLVGQQTTPAITTDMDGETRNTPTMGADEIAACPLLGDQLASGNGSWIGYVYSNYTNTATTPAAGSANYRGFVTEPAIFERNVGTDVIIGTTTQLCAAPAENFFVRYKMTLPNMAAGKYTFKVGGDDGYRLYIDDVLVTDINNWNEHGYAASSAQVIFSTTASHNFVLEYFDMPGSAHVSFTYGKIEGDPTVFGDNVWNVYGYNVEDINVQPTSTSYSGYYVDTALSINTEDKWGKLLSPSSTTGWLGASIGVDNFTVIHKRQGFPCGLYEIRMDKWDDGVELYLDGVRIFERTGYNGAETNVIVGNYKLNSTSKIELRLREGGADALVKMTLSNKASVYNNGWNVADPSNTAIRIDSDFVFTGNLDVCSCTVSAGKKLTIGNDAALNVENDVTVLADGKILVKDTGSLVQINATAAFTGSNTSFTMERNSTPMIIYDFTYWSSPVQAQVLSVFSPNTLADKYMSFNGTNWFVENRNNTMTAGRGYIIRAPQGWNATNTTGGGTYPGETFEGGVFKGIFTGKANSGTITVPILGNPSGGADLIGNPYPSPISTTAFMAENDGKTDGNFYFWTHKTRVSTTPVNGAYKYNDADYATLNKTGGVATSPIAKKPGEYIPAGQGFFVNTTGTGNFVFTNKMRAKGTSNNLQFFRNSNNAQAEAEQNNRYWLSITGTTGLYSEFLVGYTAGATNDLDNSFDATTYSSANLMLYTLLDGNQMVIQGRQAPFANADRIPVGYKAATAGSYTISINKKEGLFENGQTIYLFDTTTSQYHDLTAGDFTFTSAAGTFNSRFEVRYVNESLGVDNPVVSDSDVVVYKNGNQIAVKAKNFTIEDMQVYDITGKLLFNKKGIDSNEFSTSSLTVATQVVVVKVTLGEGQTISKKVMMN